MAPRPTELDQLAQLAHGLAAVAPELARRTGPDLRCQVLGQRVGGLKCLPLPCSSSAMARRVTAFGTLTSNGRRCSSAAIASERRYRSGMRAALAPRATTVGERQRSASASYSGSLRNRGGRCSACRVHPTVARLRHPARPCSRRLANRAGAAYGPPPPHADAERRRPHARGTGRSGDRRAERSAIAVAAVHPQPPVQGAPAHRGQRQGHALPLARRPRDFGQLGGPVVRQSRPLPPQGRGRGAKGRGDPRLRADLPVRPQQGVRARLAGRRRDAGRPEPRVLRQLGLGGGRHRAQDRAWPITSRAARASAPA